MRQKRFILYTIIMLMFPLVCMANKNTKEKFELAPALHGITTYSCSFTSIQMNGEEKPLPKEKYDAIVTDNKNGTFNLEMKLPKFGKMPGRLSIHASRIQPTSDGTINQTVSQSLHLKILFNHKYDALFKGNITNEKLHLKVNTVKASFLGIDIEAGFSLEGVVKPVVSQP